MVQEATGLYLSERYVTRPSEEQQFDDWVKKGPGKVTVVAGGSKVGKTWFAKHMGTRGLLDAYFDGPTSEAVGLPDLLQSYVFSLRELLINKAKLTGIPETRDWEGKPLQNQTDYAFRRLTETPPTFQMVWAFDHLNQLEETRIGSIEYNFLVPLLKTNKAKVVLVGADSIRRVWSTAIQHALAPDFISIQPFTFQAAQGK